MQEFFDKTFFLGKLSIVNNMSFMESNVATKEDIKIIFDLIREFKDDVIYRFEQVDQRFEQVDRQFEQIDKRLNQIDRQFVQIDRCFEQTWGLIKEEKHKRERMEDKLEKIYESRHEVEYKLTRDFVLKNLAWNTVIVFAAVGFIKIVLL